VDIDFDLDRIEVPDITELSSIVRQSERGKTRLDVPFRGGELRLRLSGSSEDIDEYIESTTVGASVLRVVDDEPHDFFRAEWRFDGEAGFGMQDLPDEALAIELEMTFDDGDQLREVLIVADPRIGPGRFHTYFANVNNPVVQIKVAGDMNGSLCRDVNHRLVRVCNDWNGGNVVVSSPYNGAHWLILSGNGPNYSDYSALGHGWVRC
jgi:hypothetical protein